MTHENAAYPKGADGRPRTLEEQAHEGARRFSPSVARNQQSIAQALLGQIASDASVLEIGSGTGEHGICISAQAAGLKWTFTEYNSESLQGIAAWIDHAARPHLYGPYQVDAASDDWTGDIEAQRFDAIFSANVIHISPFAVARGIFSGAGRLLGPAGRLVLYGPFSRDGEIAPSNASFDADLKRRDANWGVRDVERELIPVAQANGLDLQMSIDMPANNSMLIFARV